MGTLGGCLLALHAVSDLLFLAVTRVQLLDPFETNGFDHYYHLSEFTFMFRGFRSDFDFYFIPG